MSIFSFFKHKIARNPLVPLPDNAPSLLEKVTVCLITHSQKWGFEPLTHLDHLDNRGKVFLKENNIPVVCLNIDRSYMQKNQIRTVTTLEYWQEKSFLGGTITAVPAQHGRGWYHKLMANGAGFFIQLPDEPSIYICGDTVFTGDVKRALEAFEPDISVVAAGGASMDIGGPILMPLEEILDFIGQAPQKVIANHMDALNHCSTSRLILAGELEKRGLLSKTLVPDDGETLTMGVN